MAETLNWSYAVQVSDGPTVAGSGELSVEGYVKLNVSVPKNKSLDVEICRRWTPTVMIGD